MSSYRIIIPWTPKPKVSARFQGKKVYNPSAKGMSKLSQLVRESLPLDLEGPLLSGPLFAIVHFRFPLQTYVRDRRREVMDTTPHYVPPDGDNLEKFLNDSLNKVLFKDDACICWMLRSKSWTREREGSTILTIYEIGTGKPNYDDLMRIIEETIRI